MSSIRSIAFVACLLQVLKIGVVYGETVACAVDSGCSCSAASECILNCAFESSCKGGVTVTCQADQACTVNCSGNDACVDATILGNDATSLTVICDGENACGGSGVIRCPEGGSCVVECTGSGGNTCKDTDIDFNNAASFDCTGVGCTDLQTFPDDSTVPQPSTAVPTTAAPSGTTTTATPTTAAPTTAAPTTATPTTAAPTAPTTAAPTLAPTTLFPTTTTTDMPTSMPITVTGGLVVSITEMESTAELVVEDEEATTTTTTTTVVEDEEVYDSYDSYDSADSDDAISGAAVQAESGSFSFDTAKGTTNMVGLLIGIFVFVVIVVAVAVWWITKRSASHKRVKVDDMYDEGAALPSEVTQNSNPVDEEDQLVQITR